MSGAPRIGEYYGKDLVRSAAGGGTEGKRRVGTGWRTSAGAGQKGGQRDKGSYCEPQVHMLTNRPGVRDGSLVETTG